jgi:hypothetical protein
MSDKELKELEYNRRKLDALRRGLEILSKYILEPDDALIATHDGIFFGPGADPAVVGYEEPDLVELETLGWFREEESWALTL